MRYTEESRVYQGSDYVGSKPSLSPSDVVQLQAFLRTLRNQQQTYEELTANKNNFRLAQAIIHRFTTNASRIITGFQTLDVEGQIKVIANVGGNDLVLANENAGSTDSNRIACHTGADITLNSGESTLFFYDRLSSRIRTIGFT